MRATDVAIVGGGLAGSLAGAMLGRAGINALVIDPNSVYPADFRCEKLSGEQVQALRKTGIADVVLGAATAIDQLWVVRFGRFVRKRPNDQFGIYYDKLVNVIRDQVSPSVEFMRGKITAIETGPNSQTLKLSDGSLIRARLVVLASGLNNALRRTLGIERRDISPCQSVTIGFDLKPIDQSPFKFPALTYYPERAGGPTAYLSLFPIGSVMRANFFLYRDLRDPWLRAFREEPHATLYKELPGLRRVLPSFELASDIEIRPVDLYATSGYRQPGVVLVGDAFATACPAAGTGAGKAIVDVERLCNVYIPRWLATDGMDSDKISGFYDDQVKSANDNDSFHKANYQRSLRIDPRWTWRARRSAMFAAKLGVCLIREITQQVSIDTVGF